MYPTKSMFDYMSEMNRLFPRSNDNDLFQSPLTPSTSLHSFNQSMAPSSSSTSSTSPDELFQQQYERQREHLEHQFEYQRAPYESNVKEEQEVPLMLPQVYETPFVMKRQRPIVGRKILPAMDNQMPKTDKVPNDVWPEDLLSDTPPNTFTDQKYNQNAFYELFPSENMRMEFKTPLKTSPNSSTSPEMSNFRNMSPRMASASPRMSNTSLRMSEMSSSTNISPGSSTLPSSSRFAMPKFKDPIVGPGTSFRPNMGTTKMCTFCRKNGETPLVYMTHNLKEKVGNKNNVTCPILRSHVCATCGASGDNAHTITYCPVLRSTNNGLPLQSTTITLKNTRVKSNGRRRY